MHCDAAAGDKNQIWAQMNFPSIGIFLIHPKYFIWMFSTTIEWIFRGPKYSLKLSLRYFYEALSRCMSLMLPADVIKNIYFDHNGCQLNEAKFAEIMNALRLYWWNWLYLLLLILQFKQLWCRWIVHMRITMITPSTYSTNSDLKSANLNNGESCKNEFDKWSWRRKATADKYEQSSASTPFYYIEGTIWN